MRPACMADHCWESWRNRRRSAAVAGVTRQGGGSATKEGCARSCCMLTQRHVTFGVQPRWGLWERLLGGLDEAPAAAFACTAAAGSAASQPRGRKEQVVLRSNSGTKTNGAACVCLKGSNTSAENIIRERQKANAPKSAEQLGVPCARDGDGFQRRRRQGDGRSHTTVRASEKM